MKYIDVFEKRTDASFPQLVNLENHLWSNEYPCFIACRAGLFAVKNEGFFVRLEADEPCPRAVFETRDDPVYNDSCMEFFFQPFADDERYINFEINPNGAFLCAVGKGRSDRVFLRELSGCDPVVNANIGSDGWSAELFIPEQLISDVFSKSFSVADTDFIRANFYKCGDLTEQPHYSSLFPVETVTPDFHRPEYFQKILFRNEGIFLK